MSDGAPRTDRAKRVITFMALLAAVIIAVVAALQNGANVTAAIAGRNAQMLTLEVTDEFEKLGLQANFEMTVVAQGFKDLQEAQVLRLTALDLDTRGNNAEAAAARARSEVLLARVQREKPFSSMFRDARYNPTAADRLPEIQQYVNELQLTRTKLVDRLEAANRRYAVASLRADGYTFWLTVLAVSLFLLGLAQALEGSVRLPFAAMGAVALAAGTVGALMILLA